MSTSRRHFLGQVLRASTAGTALLAGARVHGKPEDGGKQWRIGCYTRPWDKYDYRVALDAIAEAGYQHAGLMTTNSPSRLVISVDTTPEEAEAVAEECRSRNLSVPSVYGGGIPVEKSRDAGIAGLKTLIDRCAVVGAENLMMGGVGDAELQKPYYEAVGACCDYAAEKRVGLSVKPHGGGNATGPQCREIIEQVGHANFRLWYDPGNILYYSHGELDPVEDAATVDGLVVGMSVKDFLPPKNVKVTPGTGEVDFPEVMERLKAGGFAGGPLVVECLAPGERPQLLEEAKKARRFLEELLRA